MTFSLNAFGDAFDGLTRIEQNRDQVVDWKLVQKQLCFDKVHRTFNATQIQLIRSHCLITKTYVGNTTSPVRAIFLRLVTEPLFSKTFATQNVSSGIVEHRDFVSRTFYSQTFKTLHFLIISQSEIYNLL